MKRYFTQLNIIFALEVVVVALASLGVLPREAVLVLTGIVVFYMIFSPVEDALWLFVASIPLFVAMPISETLDSIANWRILIGVLFLCLFFKKGVSLSLVKNSEGKWHIKENLKHGWLEYLMLAFLVIAAISIFVAEYKIIALKKLIFIASVFLLFLIIQNLTRRGSLEQDKKEILRLWQAAAVGGISVIAVALIQFITVLFIPLFTFWQFWANKIISVFYGNNLAHLLSYSNTWFSYYAENPPTLRIFSVFPDSHSFAMFNILMVPIFLGLVIYYGNKEIVIPARFAEATARRAKAGIQNAGSRVKPGMTSRRKKVFYWVMTGLTLAGVVFSGSRGAWLSVVPVIILALYFYGKKIGIFLTKKVILSLSIFILLFVASIGYPLIFYQFQAWQAGQTASTTFSFFERAKSISDIEEVSNKGRIEIWLASAKSVAQKPLLGVGFGNYAKILDQDISAGRKGASAHNLYLDIASEIGIFGALVLIAIFVNILYTAWRVFKKAEEPHLKAYGLIFGLYFLWVAGYSFFDVVLLNDKVLLILMVGLGALYSLRRISQRAQGEMTTDYRSVQIYR